VGKITPHERLVENGDVGGALCWNAVLVGMTRLYYVLAHLMICRMCNEAYELLVGLGIYHPLGQAIGFIRHLLKMGVLATCHAEIQVPLG